MKKREEKQMIVVLGLIRRPDGRFLLTKRHQPNLPSSHQKWQIPGGELEFGEEPRETLVREMTEEVGLAVEIVELLPFVGSSLWKYGDRDDHVVLLCYLVTLKGGEVILNKEANAFVWASLDEVSSEDTLPHTTTFLQLANKFLKK